MDKPFSPSTDTPFIPQNYYMQIILNKLNIKRTQPNNTEKYTFSIYKGNREFETIKEITIPAKSSESIALDKCKLNFMVNNYNPERTNDFRLVMNKVIDSKHVKEVGQLILNSNNHIDQYNISQNGAFEMNIDLNQQFAAEVELYVDKNQHGLFRIIRDLKNPKPQDVKENKPNTRLMRQRIIDARKQMDAEAEKDKNGRPSSKQKKFNRFSPKRQGSEEKKKDLFAQKRRQEEERKIQQQQELKRRQEEENNKKDKKKQPAVFKKQWIIPAAEEIKQQIARQNKLKRKTSKTSQKSEEKVKTQDNSKVKTASKEQSAINQASLTDRLGVSPKLIIPIIVILLLAAGYFLFMKPAEQSSVKSKANKPKKASKAEKAPKQGKAKAKSRK